MARGSVVRYKTGWAIRWDGGNDQETGRRRQRFESGFASKGDAEAALVKRLASEDKGVRSRHTLSGYVDYWLELVAAGAVRENSLRRYRELLMGHVVPTFGAKKLDTIHPPALHALYRRLSNQGLSAQTIRGVHATLHRLLACAVLEGKLAFNPLERVTPPQAERHEMRTWNAQELATFLEHCRTERHGTLWRLYAMSGLRRGEALGLRWRDVDWAKNQIHVRQQAQRIGEETKLVPLKTPASRRTVTLDSETLTTLRTHRARQAAERIQRGTLWQDNDLVFAAVPERRRSTLPGEPWHPDVIGGKFQLAVERSGLPMLRLHDLRHTHATLLLREDGNVKAIAARLGHDPSVLLRVYAHAGLEDQTRAVDRLTAALTHATAPQHTAAH